MEQTNAFANTQHRVKFAFEVGGVKYYEMDDLFNIPYKRGLAAMSVYEELRMKCTREYLEAHSEAMNNILTGPKFNMESAMQIKKLNDQLRERLKWVVDTDLAYKLAAVVFFDETEKPESYEPKYAQEKIALWKKHEGVADFFLREPLLRLLPFLRDSDLNLEAYSQAVAAFNEVHLGNIFSNLSEEQKKTFTARQSTSSAPATPPS